MRPTPRCARSSPGRRPASARRGRRSRRGAWKAAWTAPASASIGREPVAVREVGELGAGHVGLGVARGAGVDAEQLGHPDPPVPARGGLDGAGAAPGVVEPGAALDLHDAAVLPVGEPAQRHVAQHLDRTGAGSGTGERGREGRQLGVVRHARPGGVRRRRPTSAPSRRRTCRSPASRAWSEQ